MVIVSPRKDRATWDPFQMAVSWLLNGGDPNHLLTGMILQEHPFAILRPEIFRSAKADAW